MQNIKVCYMRVTFGFLLFILISVNSNAQCHFCQMEFNKKNDYVSQGLNQLYREFIANNFRSICEGINMNKVNLIVHKLSDTGIPASSLMFTDSSVIRFNYSLNDVILDSIKMDKEQRYVFNMVFHDDVFLNDGIPAFELGLNHFQKFLMLSSRSCYVYQIDYPTYNLYDSFWNVVNVYFMMD